MGPSLSPAKEQSLFLSKVLRSPTQRATRGRMCLENLALYASLMTFLWSWPRHTEFWALQLVAPKDKSDSLSYSTTSFPIFLRGSMPHTSLQTTVGPWASLKHKVLCPVKPVCSLPPHSQVLHRAWIPYSPTNRGPTLLNRPLISWRFLMLRRTSVPADMIIQPSP